MILRNIGVSVFHQELANPSLMQQTCTNVGRPLRVVKIHEFRGFDVDIVRQWIGRNCQPRLKERENHVIWYLDEAECPDMLRGRLSETTIADSVVVVIFGALAQADELCVIKVGPAKRLAAKLLAVDNIHVHGDMRETAG